jgi:hypothetical protein
MIQKHFQVPFDWLKSQDFENFPTVLQLQDLLYHFAVAGLAVSFFSCRTCCIILQLQDLLCHFAVAGLAVSFCKETTLEETEWNTH